MPESLDFLYVPAASADAAARWYVEVLRGRLDWSVRGFGTRVECVHVAGTGPAVLLSGHLEPGPPVAVYRVDGYAATVGALRAAGVDELTELGIPHGPCASSGLPDGQRAAVSELVRPEAASHFAARSDP